MNVKRINCFKFQAYQFKLHTDDGILFIYVGEVRNPVNVLLTRGKTEGSQ